MSRRLYYVYFAVVVLTEVGITQLSKGKTKVLLDRN